MKKINKIFAGILILFVAFAAAAPAVADDWKYPLGISYVQSFNGIIDLLETNRIAESLENTSPDAFPAGINFQPFLQLDNGIRVGAGIGPCMFTYGNASYYDIPINVNAGYTFYPEENRSPYFRGGIVQHVISGDYFYSSGPGAFVAVGYEFMRKNRVSFGIELAYDSCKIKMDKKTLIQFFDVAGTLQPYSSIQTGTDIFTVGPYVTFYAIF